MKPPASVEKHAHQHTAANYYSITGTGTPPNLRKRLIQCLDRGYPFVFGMKTYGLLSEIAHNGGRGLSASIRINFLFA